MIDSLALLERMIDSATHHEQETVVEDIGAVGTYGAWSVGSCVPLE